MLDLRSVGLFGQAFKFIDVWGKWLKESHRTQLFEVDKIVFIGYSIIIFYLLFALGLLPIHLRVRGA